MVVSFCLQEEFNLKVFGTMPANNTLFLLTRYVTCSHEADVFISSSFFTLPSSTALGMLVKDEVAKFGIGTEKINLFYSQNHA
jgi:hypothetical protein